MLARMEQPDFPQPVGIFPRVERATYEEMMVARLTRPSRSPGREVWRS
jgi:hypothetical protein